MDYSNGDHARITNSKGLGEGWNVVELRRTSGSFNLRTVGDVDLDRYIESLGRDCIVADARRLPATRYTARRFR